MSNSSRVLETGLNQITQHYGNKGHSGVDLVKYKGQIDNIIAHSDGTIIFCQTGMTNNNQVGNNASYGNCVKIRHNNGMCTLYAHLAGVKVRMNQKVSKGQIIGLMGNTGNSTAAHLHFEVFDSNGRRINPEPYLNADLPGGSSNPGYTGTITYQAYNGKWESEVHKVDDTPEGYAGDGIHYISGVRAKPQYGEIKIKSHILNGGWLNEVSSKDYVTNDTQNSNTYSGIYEKPLDAIMFTTTVGYIDARVKTKRGYLPWVRFYKTFNETIYVGNFGEPILGLQIK